MSSPAIGRPMRRDAARNQQLVLAAAREVLAESGLEASMETIAARAGVGVGTVYRRFPSKDALIEGLVGDILEQLIDSARQALTRQDGSGLACFLGDLGQSFAEHRRYADVLMGVTDTGRADTLRGLIAELHAQAHQHQLIAADVSLADVMSTAWALRGVVQSTGATTPRAWERYLELALRGLRADPSDR